MSEAAGVLGIDLGAAFVHWASVRDRDPPTKDDRGGGMFPSAVASDARGRPVVGARAIARLALHPAKTMIAPHIALATGDRSSELDPAAALELVFRHVREEACVDASEGTPTAIATYLSSATLDAAALDVIASAAGLVIVGRQTPAVAAAMGLVAQRRLSTGPALVIDVGARHTEVAALAIDRRGGVEVVAREISGGAGGDSIDDLLALRATAHLSPRVADVLRRDRAARQMLRSDCARAREVLSDATTVELTMPWLSTFCDGARGTATRIQRAEFDRLAAPIARRIARLCQRVLAAASRTPGSSGPIVLIGGVSRTPVLREAIEQAVGATALPDIDADGLAAAGAAHSAALWNRARSKPSRRNASERPRSRHPPTQRPVPIVARPTPLIPPRPSLLAALRPSKPPT